MAAFSLLFVVPIVSVALGWLVGWALDLLGLTIPAAVVLIAVPPLLAGAVSRAVCSARGVAPSTTWSFALGSGVIALLILIASYAALVSLTVD